MTPPPDPRTPCPPDPPSRTSSSCPCRSPRRGSTAVTSVGLGELPQAQIQIQAQAHPQAQNSPYGTNHAPGAQLAVVNLTKSFAAQHPSGIEVEDLTLRSILATIHNLLPRSMRSSSSSTASLPTPSPAPATSPAPTPSRTPPKASTSSPPTATPSNCMQTIGVFDSGFGGLTVLRALLPLVPGAHFVYLGDTARLPYGEKSQQTIARYALSSAAFLLAQGAEMLVVACNTASALALDELRASLPIPVIGVIEPGTQAARLATSSNLQNPQILVLATSATVRSGAYTRACQARRADCFREKPARSWCPWSREGWIDHPVTAEVVRIYLSEALALVPKVTTLVLGCTHYPLLKPLIERTLLALNHPLHIVDSAHATAEAAAALLPPTRASAKAECTFYATDSIEKFQRLGSAFLGRPLPHVNLVDLGG